MIFVTLGTTNFQFTRLLKTLDSILIKQKSNEQLIVQDKSKCYKFKYKNTKMFSEISFPKLVKYLSSSKTVITHGGLASIFLAEKYSKNQPIIVPRNPKYKEHINNHQMIFSNLLKKQNNCQIITKNLTKKLDSYIKKPTLKNNCKKFFCSSKLINNLDNFCKNV